MPVANRHDPYFTFNFLVEIEGITVAGFTEVSGLTIQTELETKKFGGDNTIEYKFVKGTKYSDLTLKHGITDLDLLWNCYNDVIKGKVKRKNGSIYLRDQAGQRKMGWHFLEAFPIKWDGPTFNASTSTVATESLVLTHRGLIKF